MAYSPLRFYGPTPPPTVETALYTAPSPIILKEILIVNITGTPATISLSIVPFTGTAASGNRLMQTLVVQANTFERIGLTTPMATGDFISGIQGTAGAINLTISGVII